MIHRVVKIPQERLASHQSQEEPTFVTSESSGVTPRMGEIGSDGGSQDCPTHPIGNHPGISAEKSNTDGSPPGPSTAVWQENTLKPRWGREHGNRYIRHLDGDVHIVPGYESESPEGPLVPDPATAPSPWQHPEL